MEICYWKYLYRLHTIYTLPSYWEIFWSKECDKWKMNRRKKRRGNIGKIFLRKTDQPEKTFFKIVRSDTGLQSGISYDDVIWNFQIDILFRWMFQNKDKLRQSTVIFILMWYLVDKTAKHQYWEQQLYKKEDCNNQQCFT